MIKEIFSDGGLLAKTLSRAGRFARMRVPQREYAQFVDEGIAAGHPVFADAETGVGKTLGYLVPVLLRAFADRKAKPIVVISTATVVLQRQILAEDIPIAADVVREVLGFEPKAEFRIGKEQVVDVDRLAEAIHQLVPPEERALADEMKAWTRAKIEARDLPLRSDLIEAFADRIDGAKAWLAPSVIGLQNADGDSGELYADLLERCDAADILVVNHHLLTINMFRQFLWNSERPVYLVVDEADRLPNIVESIDRIVVPLHALRRTLGTWPEAEEASVAVDTLSNIAMSHFDKAWIGSSGGAVQVSRLDLREKAEIHAAASAARHSIEALSDRLSKSVRRPTAAGREAKADLDRARYELGMICTELDSGRGNALLYYSPVRRYPGIASINPGSSRAIASRLWNKSPFNMKALVFTSATLGTMATSGADTDHKRALTAFISDCGFKIADIPSSACRLIAPNRFGEMKFVRPPLGIPKPFVASDTDDLGGELNAEAVETWASMVLSAAGKGGRVLVLAPGFRDIGALAPLLDELGPRLILQVPGIPTAVAISRFVSRPDSVWVSASAWEGVSLPQMISHIVIPRIPIRPSSLEDNLVESYFRENGFEGKGKSLVFARRMAEARRRLRQGMGRGIRSGDDSVTVWLGDARWPLTQAEMDAEFLDQPATWSSTMMNAVPRRFRKVIEASERYRSP